MRRDQSPAGGTPPDIRFVPSRPSVAMMAANASAIPSSNPGQARTSGTPEAVHFLTWGRWFVGLSGMKRAVAALALALGFFASPILGIAAMDVCPPCCSQPAEAPCESGDAPCLSVAVVSCCDAPLAALSSDAKRNIDPPNHKHLVTMVRRAPPVSFSIVLPPWSDADLALRTSPLRLSVVLLV